MRSLLPATSLLLVLAAALPAAAELDEQRGAWCFGRASNEQMIEGCSAVIAAGRDSAEKLFQAYDNRGSAHAMSGDYKRAIDDYSEALKRSPATPSC